MLYQWEFLKLPSYIIHDDDNNLLERLLTKNVYSYSKERKSALEQLFVNRLSNTFETLMKKLSLIQRRYIERKIYPINSPVVTTDTVIQDCQYLEMSDHWLFH